MQLTQQHGLPAQLYGALGDQGHDDAGPANPAVGERFLAAQDTVDEHLVFLHFLTVAPGSASLMRDKG